MAERTGPLDGARYKRAKPSGNHKGRNNGKNGQRPGRKLDTFKGETLWTPELQDKLVKMIQAGNYAEVAARACGINTSTFYAWLSRGGQGEEPFANLAKAIEKATAEGELRDFTLIGKHAEKQWQAAAWRLERKLPQRYGRKDSLEVTGDEAKPLSVVAARVDFGRLSEQERAEFMRIRDKMRVLDDEPKSDDEAG